MEEQHIPIPLGHKIRGMLIHPSQTMATASPILGEGVLVVVWLVMTAGLKAALEIAYTTGLGPAWLAFPGATLGIISAWAGMTALFHLIARLLGGKGSYLNLLALMGYAATPMILTTSISIIIYIISPVLLPDLGGAKWSSLHTLIGWIGMTWGWPGLLSYYALRHGEKISACKAGATIVGAYTLMLLGCSCPCSCQVYFNKKCNHL